MRLTTPWAIVLASAILGATIIGARLIAPYQVGVNVGADGTLSIIWRANKITGEIQICRALPVRGGIVVSCPNATLPTVDELLGPHPAQSPKAGQ
jgi:hypothetical protein